MITYLLTGIVAISSPYVRVSNIGEQERIWSGVVISETEDDYHILTCAHGIDDLHRRNIHLQVDFVDAGQYNYVSVPATLIKKDIDRDLALIKCPKLKMVTIKPVPLGKDPPKNSRSTVCGFAGRKKMAIRSYTVRSIGEYQGTNGEDLLLLNGRAVSGFSGGAVISNGKIVGVQSSGTNVNVTCASLQQIKDFTKKAGINK